MIFSWITSLVNFVSPRVITAFGLSLLTALLNLAIAAPLPSPPLLSANSYLLFDHTSGEVLAAKDPDKRIEPASLTKMMTAYIVASELKRGSISLDEPVIISAEAQAMPGSRMFVEAGTVVSVKDLLRGLIIQSGNDASVALAEHVAASERGFVDIMNRMALNLGMTGTRFANASGLPHPDHYTTANDLGKISSAIIREHPETYKLYSEREFTFNNITQKNRNTLLWRDDSVDGMKTGHTEAAGYCLVASSVRDGMRLISIVLGTASDKARIAESQRLLNYGYRFFKTRRVYAAGEQISEARIWMGQSESLGLGVAEDLYLTLPRDAFDSLQSTIEVADYIRAPMRIGQKLGRSVLMADNQVVGEVPLLALQKIEQGGIFLRMKHSIQRYFQ
ncbi:D-alanyl-D-alanine carboxypeptidase [Granulosicoccus sp.]|nr:D-alanyl-D-alanine carboxypeptidase family protein [Granulosicoccus sp.]MDB4223170.1 D-alanyl-D-alanine carboxypeptidase [Granulosicoccus sp.]